MEEKVVVRLRVFIVHNAQEVAAVLVVRRSKRIFGVERITRRPPRTCVEAQRGVSLIAVHSEHAILVNRGPGVYRPVWVLPECVGVIVFAADIYGGHRYFEPISIGQGFCRANYHGVSGLFAD